MMEPFLARAGFSLLGARLGPRGSASTRGARLDSGLPAKPGSMRSPPDLLRAMIPLSDSLKMRSVFSH
jgi:hypothetical protein